MQMPLRGSNSDSICEIEELMFKFVIIRAGIRSKMVVYTGVVHV